MPATFAEAYRRLAATGLLPLTLEPVFAAWYALLAKWNEKINLTRVIEPERVVACHLADSQPLAQAMPANGSLLDIGSGAGVPGLIVAALRPDVQVTCAEARMKKAAFLVQAAAKMELKNAYVAYQRAEDIGERFAVVTARAVADPANLAKRFGHLLTPGGKLAVFAAQKTALVTMQGFEIEEEITYELPFGEGPRRLVLITRSNHE